MCSNQSVYQFNNFSTNVSIPKYFYDQEKMNVDLDFPLLLICCKRIVSNE